MNGYEPSVTLWACLCCTLVMANGECCDSDQHGGDGKEPLSSIPEGCHTSLGMDWRYHDSGCLRHDLFGEAPPDYECDCDRMSFSWRACDACGSNLGGERHAFVIWYPTTVA